MPWIDAARSLLVLRIVYDGPPMSGKTTSVTALSAGVAGTVQCPAQRDGRTLYFDWVEYVGGLFEGRQIRCQIVTVPGQREFAHRRKYLLESADAVVCVLDTTRDELERASAWLSELSGVCRQRNPPVGIVLQANKRDASDALPRAELSARLTAAAPVAIVEAVATTAEGIREAFVLAVRLALDRVRALAAEGALPDSAPIDDDAGSLLRNMQMAEVAMGADEAGPRMAAEGTPAPEQALQMLELTPCSAASVERELAAAPGVEQGELPFSPDPAMPGGMIWPPVDGRAMLHEVARLSIRAMQTPRGDFWGAGGGWCFHSSRNGLFHDTSAARGALLRWARLHVAHLSHISPQRVVILADVGRGRLRLWQLVRLEVALRERLATVMAASDPGVVVQGIWEVSERLLSARQRFTHAGANLPSTLWTVSGASEVPPTFVGLMPAPEQNVPEIAPRLLLERELSAQLVELRRTRDNFGDIVRELRARCQHCTSDALGNELSLLLERVAALRPPRKTKSELHRS